MSMLKKAGFIFIFLIFLFLAGCAAGPTPERVGFNYPQAGVRFSPRVHVVSDTVRGDVAEIEGSEFTLLFPLTKSEIEGPNKRLLTTGIVGEWNDNKMPLYDEVSINLFGVDPNHSYKLTEEREIDVPWRGVETHTGTYRVFEMTPTSEGPVQYTVAVLVHHYGNTIELCWRDSTTNPPDQAKLEEFFYWTRGLVFFEPETQSN
jgi:hypothetical protein